MKFLFATGSSHLPEQVGGAEHSIHTLLQLLNENGHDCEAVLGLRRGWRRKIARRLFVLSAGRRLGLSDRRNGYRPHRTSPWLVPKLMSQRLEAVRPDLVITQLDRDREIAALLATKLFTGVTTSSPGPIPSASMLSSSAEIPLSTPTANLASQ